MRGGSNQEQYTCKDLEGGVFMVLWDTIPPFCQRQREISVGIAGFWIEYLLYKSVPACMMAVKARCHSEHIAVWTVGPLAHLHHSVCTVNNNGRYLSAELSCLPIETPPPCPTSSCRNHLNVVWRLTSVNVPFLVFLHSLLFLPLGPCICVCIYTYIYIYICVCVCVCVCKHTYVCCSAHLPVPRTFSTSLGSTQTICSYELDSLQNFT